MKTVEDFIAPVQKQLEDVEPAEIISEIDRGDYDAD